jgi:RNA polymerase sigma-70 factor, ECF subfamily
MDCKLSDPPCVYTDVGAIVRGLLSDQQLITLVVRGRAEMFGELVARYQKPVYRLACAMLSDRTEAEDAAQEVFIKAHKHLASYSEAGKFWGWLRRITINVCLRKVRPVMTSLDEISEIPGHAGDVVYETVVSSAEAEELRGMIDRLPPHYRSVIVLRYLEDMSYAEISEALGETVSNVQVRAHRAKKMLRDRMKVRP